MAKGGSAEHEEKKVIGQKWFIPLAPAAAVAAMLPRVTGRRVDIGALDWRPLSKRAFRRRARVEAVGALVIAGILLLIFRPWGLFGEEE